MHCNMLWLHMGTLRRIHSIWHCVGTDASLKDPNKTPSARRPVQSPSHLGTDRVRVQRVACPHPDEAVQAERLWAHFSSTIGIARLVPVG